MHYLGNKIELNEHVAIVNIVLCRDKTEKLSELDEARKKELTQSENSRYANSFSLFVPIFFWPSWLGNFDNAEQCFGQN